jgi:hypothetical protein
MGQEEKVTSGSKTGRSSRGRNIRLHQCGIRSTSRLSTWTKPIPVLYKILVLQVKSLSHLQQHYKILAGKRLSDTDEIFFRYPQHLSLYIETT